ncbi:unnamed protein product [Cunninghamella blakesleeana]
MYDSNVKYIAISYRWGELNEQLVETPDYTAFVTSFDVCHLEHLCLYISYDPDLCNMNYLWIDAISIDQQNQTRKTETILKMNQIYQNASYILAVPDLHREYLWKNTTNREIMKLIIYKYSAAVYNEIINISHLSSADSTQQQQQLISNDKYSFVQKLKNMINEVEKLNIKDQELKMNMEEIELKMKELKMEMEENELKDVYQFLAYLIEDWSNRAWVISEYHIAKEKYKKHGTPLKYWFITLFIFQQPFFSYYFNDDVQHQESTTNNENKKKDNKTLTYEEVIHPETFHQFVKSRFIQQSYLEMILNSKATRNEDRFNAILPLWNKYHHLIKNVSEWNITSMVSVRLKLYEIINDGDLWEKAALLYACTIDSTEIIILPSFASQHDAEKLKIIEKYNYNSIAYKEFEVGLLDHIRECINEEKVVQIKQLIDEYKTNSKPIWAENLTSIQFKQHQCCLSVKSNSYFVKNESSHESIYYRNKLSLDEDDAIQYAFIPFFNFTSLLGYMDEPLIYECSSSTYLVGNRDKNKWMLINDNTDKYISDHFCSDDYTFNIY